MGSDTLCTQIMLDYSFTKNPESENVRVEDIKMEPILTAAMDCISLAGLPLT